MSPMVVGRCRCPTRSWETVGGAAAGLRVRELAALSGIANGYVPMMDATKLRALPSEAVLRRLARALRTTVLQLRGRQAVRRRDSDDGHVSPPVVWAVYLGKR